MTSVSQSTMSRTSFHDPKIESRRIFAKYIHTGTIISGHAPMPFESCRKHDIERWIPQILSEKYNIQFPPNESFRFPEELHGRPMIPANFAVTFTKVRPFLVVHRDPQSNTAICLYVKALNRRWPHCEHLNANIP